ncbi:MAG: exodeoxyribonuclease III [Rickettsiales bacterium]|nr:exodeoxyribonuclease III [Rickettsiales bacterium]
MVQIATWNVNSIKSRLQHLTQWLQDSGVDIVLLQETKTVDDAFPKMEIEELGYNIAIHGQKTYNGVAILSKFPIDDVVCGLPGDDSDEQARYIEGVISLPENAIRVASIYVPNGQAVDSEKFPYKMNFFERLHKHAAELMSYDEVCVLGGDYNVAPEAHDLYDPIKWDGKICYHPKEREHFRRLTHAGWYDAFRLKNPSLQQYSWWDYRGGSYQNGEGLRIDHLLLSPSATDILESSVIDETPRGWEKPSDHTPVIATLAA